MYTRVARKRKGHRRTRHQDTKNCDSESPEENAMGKGSRGVAPNSMVSWLTDTSCGSQSGESRGPFNPDRHYPPRPGKRHRGRIRAGAQPKQAPDREFEVESPAEPAPADLEVA